ncbi:MAG TPA: ComEA family DNA-binding protein [Chloroflexia bacterium]|nr:ComEA family DNA-binding protein [Chloroflexia bacterium]
MKNLLTKQVSFAWLLLVLVAGVAGAVLWKVAVVDAPPHNSVLIESGAIASPQPVASPTAREEAQTTVTAAPSTPLSTQAVAAAPPTPQMLAVYVSGAVLNPGVYMLPEGSRISDAIQAAGGPQPDANMELINLAARVSDEQHISVLRTGETPVAQVPPQQPANTPQAQSKQQATPQPKPTGKLNLNTATAAQLEELPGIGEVLAARIVEYRDTNGPFKTVEEIMSVPGIKEAVYEQIRNLVTVEP